MKTKFFLIAFVLISTIATASTSINKTEVSYMDCSGNFNIDGRSYTITLHDVSWWTCAKFKVASLFN